MIVAKPKISNNVDGESRDECKTCLLASIGTFYPLVEIVSNKKNTERTSTNYCRILAIMHFRILMKRYNASFKLVSKN
jgi:hypothetical protein